MDENNKEILEDTEETSLEELFDQMDNILAQLNDSGISLEDSISLYEQGKKILNQCYVKLDLVEKKIKKIDENGSEVPFDYKPSNNQE